MIGMDMTIDDIENQINELSKTPLKENIAGNELTNEELKNIDNILKILEKSAKKILVVGDVMLDHLMVCYGTSFLQSHRHNVNEDYSVCRNDNDREPEEVKRLGGAANVAYCCSVFSNVTLFGPIGEDMQGKELVHLAELTENITPKLFPIKDFFTITKMYFHCLDENHTLHKVIRINRELNEHLGTEKIKPNVRELGENFRSLLKDGINCVIFKDHQKGFITKEFLQEIAHDINAKLHNDEEFLVIIDPKYNWEKFLVFDKIHAIISNVKEAAAGIFSPDILNGKNTREMAIQSRLENRKLNPGDWRYLSQKYPNIENFVVNADGMGSSLYHQSSDTVYSLLPYKEKGGSGVIGSGGVFDAFFVHCLMNEKQIKSKLGTNDYSHFLRLANVASGIKLKKPTSEKVIPLDISLDLGIERL